MTKAELLLDKIVDNEGNRDNMISDIRVGGAAARSLERYFNTERMSAVKLEALEKWLFNYLRFVSEIAPEAFDPADQQNMKALVCYASMIYGDENWKELTALGFPKFRVDEMTNAQRLALTDIDILKRCKEVCCWSVQQRKKGTVR